MLSSSVWRGLKNSIHPGRTIFEGLFEKVQPQKKAHDGRGVRVLKGAQRRPCPVCFEMRPERAPDPLPSGYAALRDRIFIPLVTLEAASTLWRTISGR
jgi:hypothetical protein